MHHHFVSFSSVDQWLESVGAPVDQVSAADKRTVSFASLDEHVNLAKEFAKNDLYGLDDYQRHPRRFPLARGVSLGRFTPWHNPDHLAQLRKWLYECGIRFCTQTLCHSRSSTVRAPWKFFVRYLPLFDRPYPLITDSTMQWALECHYWEYWTFYCYRTRPKAGRKNWDFVLRVFEGLKVVSEEPSDDTETE